jgi:hypothetical protein
MITQISPAEWHCNETLNTLRYASKIKETKKGRKNFDNLLTMKENNDDSNPILPFMKTTDKTDFENHRGRRAGTTLNFSNTLNKNNNIINQNIEYSADISNGNVSKNKVYKQNAIATQIMNQSDTSNKSRIPGIKFKGERPRTPESKIKVDKTIKHVATARIVGLSCSLKPVHI